MLDSTVTPCLSGVEKIGIQLRAEADAVSKRRRSQRRVHVLAGALLVGALMAVPLMNAGAFNLERFGVAIAYIMAAIGLNLAFGYAGELAIGHSAIMAVGAYAAGIMSAQFGMPAAFAIPLGVAVGVLFGLLTMLPGLRVQGWYLALITMFAVLVIPHVVDLGEAWTGGEYGLTGIGAIEIFGLHFGNIAAYEFIVVAFALVWLMTINFVRSAWGYRMRGLRDARRAAEAVGISLEGTRFVVYVLSAVPAALAGVVLAYAQRFVNADSFNLSLTLLLLTGVVLGGAGTVWGPLVGMAPLVALSFWVGPFSQYNAVVLGFALLLGVLAFPDGVVEACSGFLRRNFGRDRPTPPCATVTPVRLQSEAALDAWSERPPAADTMVVRTRGVVRRFGGVLALDSIDFDLERGRLCGLVGPNGSGKSTFLNALSGFFPPDAGTIVVTGQDITRWRAHQISRAGVGRTFQVPQLIGEFTALENIEMGLIGGENASILGTIFHSPAIARRAVVRRRRALATLAMVGLPPESIRDPVEKLPLGLKRTVEVARAIVSMPTLLLLDEPASGLNDDERSQLGQLLLKLRDVGITILLVEHNVPFVMGICDEVALLENGRITCRTPLGGVLPERLASYLNYAPADPGYPNVT
jgi:branched-chain amino acid transport system permease protein